MVKVMRSFTLDSETVEMLSNADNASGLINRLVREHFEETTSNDPKVLLNKKMELETEVDILKRKLEHVTDKLIIVERKEKQKTSNENYKQAMIMHNQKAEELQMQWQNNQISEDDYWKMMDELKRSRPNNSI